MDVKECCDKWWAGLSDLQKRWIHYYFFDIKEHPLNKLKDIEERHEFRFVEEGNPRW